MNVIHCDLCKAICGSDAKKFSATLQPGEAVLLVADVCPDCTERVRTLLQGLVAAPVENLESLERVEQRQILAVMTATDWNKSQAARILGIERTTLERKLRKYRATKPVR